MTTTIVYKARTGQESRPRDADFFRQQALTFSLGTYAGRVDDAVAIRYAQQACVAEPLNVTSHAVLAEVCLRAKKYDAALAAANQARRLDPRHHGAINTIAAIHLERRDWGSFKQIAGAITKNNGDGQDILRQRKGLHSTKHNAGERHVLSGGLVSPIYRYQDLKPVCNIARRTAGMRGKRPEPLQEKIL